MVRDVHDIDMLMEDIATRLEAVGSAHGRTSQAQIDRLETMYLRLYQSKVGSPALDDDAEPLDALREHRPGRGKNHRRHHHRSTR